MLAVGFDDVSQLATVFVELLLRHPLRRHVLFSQSGNSFGCCLCQVFDLEVNLLVIFAESKHCRVQGRHLIGYLFKV